MEYNKSVFHKKALMLCAIGKECYERGWSPATSSNYSIRFADDSCVLTSSGKHKGRLQPEDILLVDMQGQSVGANTGRPSAETLLHTQLYQFDKRIGAVLHTHSPNSVMISEFLGKDVLELEGWELLKALSGITTHETKIDVPIFENTQDIAGLAQQVNDKMQSSQLHAYLIKGHGIYTWGKDLDECFRHLEALESMMEYELKRLTLKS